MAAKGECSPHDHDDDDDMFQPNISQIYLNSRYANLRRSAQSLGAITFGLYGEAFGLNLIMFDLNWETFGLYGEAFGLNLMMFDLNWETFGLYHEALASIECLLATTERQLAST